jgi:valyl-tRNA synthetase
MDTWATSSISPQLNSMAVTKEFAVDYERHQKLFPADLRPQAHEIIRTWAFYTIVKSLYHEDTIPWKNLMISGWCLDANRAKMSKSKGNVVTPRELIEQKGADIVRYWASNSKLGVDIAYSEDVFKIGHRLCTKLWNASKFVHIHLANVKGIPSTTINDINQGTVFESLDLWLITKLTRVIESSTKSFLEFEYSDARVAIEEFFWKDFCDNYLELIKGRIYNEESEHHKSRQSAIYTLYHSLKTLFKLFAPFMPHLVEQLNLDIFHDKDSIHRKGNWPKLEEFHQDNLATQEGENCIAILELVRKYKSTHNLSLKTQLNLVEYSGIELSTSSAVDLKNAANTNNIAYNQTLKGDDLLKSEDNRVFVKVVN